jgi:type IV pilus assembly protein PilM
MDKTLFYQDKSLFGLDIGFRTVKVMQLQKADNAYGVSGYGITEFDPAAIVNGVIVDFDAIAGSIHDLFVSGVTGEISTRRVAVSVPASRTYSRILSLPLLPNKDIAEAVRLEAEQYIPVAIDDLYIDFTVINKGAKNMDILAVAVPKKIIDSYLELCRVLNLEPVVMETTTGATNRLFRYIDTHNIPTVLIDFGSVATDISIYDKFLAITGTIATGGDNITAAIVQNLGVTPSEALTIKVKYGLNASKKQAEIVSAVEPLLGKTIKEVRRMIRYYEERSDTQSRIEQIMTFGGGSNVPGLSAYLIDHLRVPVRACEPWDYIQFKHIKPPDPVQQSLYVTAASLALIKPGEAFS